MRGAERKMGLYDCAVYSECALLAWPVFISLWRAAGSGMQYKVVFKSSQTEHIKPQVDQFIVVEK